MGWWECTGELGTSSNLENLYIQVHILARHSEKKQLVFPGVEVEVPEQSQKTDNAAEVPPPFMFSLQTILNILFQYIKHKLCT